MTRVTYAVVKAGDPAALVLAASVLPRASSGGMTRARKYLAALQRASWPVDAMTTHIYPEVGYWGPRWKSMLTDVTSTLRSMNAPAKLWITETQFGLLGPTVTDAAAIDTAIRDLYRDDGGRFAFWYGWNRLDLGGFQLDETSPAWASIKARHSE